MTDVGSVKGPVLAGIRPALSNAGVFFIGSHPMAGTEKSGLDNAKEDLYDGAVVFVTQVAGDDAAARETVCSFWRRLTMVPHVLNPDTHDMLVARTSHVLHLLSYGAAHAYLAGEKSHLATGGGFRDFTRIAGSSPDMWTEILEKNRGHVLEALDEFVEEIDCLRTFIANSNWDAIKQYLTEARERRNSWVAQWTQRRGGRS